jgi:hypothetical protein
MEPTPEEIRRLSHELLKKLAAEGKIIEGGWAGYRLIMDQRAGEVQINETRIAFFAGAQHLFASIMGILDPGREPTQKDLEQMSLIAKELENFAEEYKRKHGLTGRY